MRGWARAAWALVALVAGCEAGSTTAATHGSVAEDGSGSDAGSIDLGDPEADPDAEASDEQTPDGADAVEADDAAGQADSDGVDSSDGSTSPDAVTPDVGGVDGTLPDVPVAVDTTPVDPCPVPTAAGHHKLECDGIKYDIEIPATCPADGCGLIIDIHGLSMTGDQEDANTELRKIGTAAGYVVVQPTAPTFLGFLPSWDQGQHAGPVFAMASHVAEILGTDSKRAHATGFSQGGGMTWRLLCDHAEFFASVAPLGALEGCPFQTGGGSPNREVDILAMHGRSDAVVNFSVAESQRDKAIGAWPFGAGVVVTDAGGLTMTRYTTESGTVLETWWHDYEASNTLLKGHCFPGSPELSGILLFYGCQEPGTFDTGQTVLDFFIAHPLP